MIFGKTKLEMKLGIFVFVGMIITIVFILSIGKNKNNRDDHKIGRAHV